MRCEKIAEQFTSLLQLARIGFVSDFEDGIGDILPAFRCCLRASMEEIQEGITQCQISANTSSAGSRDAAARRAKRSRAAIRKAIARAFGCSFDLESSSVVSRVAAVFVRNPGFASSPNGRLDCGAA